MKPKILFVIIFLVPMLAQSQPRNYASIAFGKDFPKHYHVIGGHFTGNKGLGKGFFVGAGTAFLKFDNTEKFYFPVFANISLLRTQKTKKIFPVAFIQPGYGFYKHSESSVTTKGGFTFHSSAGIGYPFLWHTKGFTSFGISHYSFKTNMGAANRTSWGLRVAMLL